MASYVFGLLLYIGFLGRFDRVVEPPNIRAAAIFFRADPTIKPAYREKGHRLKLSCEASNPIVHRMVCVLHNFKANLHGGCIH